MTFVFDALTESAHDPIAGVSLRVIERGVIPDFHDWDTAGEAVDSVGLRLTAPGWSAKVSVCLYGADVTTPHDHRQAQPTGPDPRVVVELAPYGRGIAEVERAPEGPEDPSVARDFRQWLTAQRNLFVEGLRCVLSADGTRPMRFDFEHFL